MKKIYFNILILCVSNLFAQTITQSFNEPIIGDINKLIRLDTSAYTTGIPNGNTGNNCLWDFSNITGTFPFVVDSFLTPGAVAGASLYPSATYVQHRDTYNTFYKSTSSPSQLELLGGGSPTLALTFTNTAIAAKYPMSYGTNFVDPVGGTYKYNTTTGAEIGSITVSADAIGTLQVYGGASFINVLRVKSVEELTLNVGILPYISFRQTIYDFYVPGRKFPLINLNYTNYNLLFGGTPTITALCYGSQDYFRIVGVPENKLENANYSVYPNPFDEQLVITANDAAENTYFIYDLNGKLIINTKSINIIETSNLEKGMYFLEVKNKTGTYRQKIIKE